MQYYKLLNRNLKDDGIVYHMGLNKISVPFNPEINDNYSSCCSKLTNGGLYFSDQDHVFILIRGHRDPDELVICRVMLANDSKLIKFNDLDMHSDTHNNRTMYKTDKLIITSIQSLEDFFVTNPNLIINAVEQNNIVLKYIKNQTEQICLAAVRANGWALQYVKNQTPEICLQAVKLNNSGVFGSSLCLEYVKSQTPEICLAAVQSDGHALQYVNDHTDTICMAAVKRTGDALQYVKRQTPEICLAAIKKCGLALEYVEDHILSNYPELCIIALKQYGSTLKYVKEQNSEICFLAINQDAMALQYVKDQTKEICLTAVKKRGRALRFVKDKTSEYYQEIRSEALKQDPYADNQLISEYENLY
jgi:hypothetical protein